MTPETSSTGIDIAVAAMLAYVAGWLTGAFFLIVEKKSRFVRFHAWQSVLTFLPIFIVIWILPFSFLFWPVSVALWIVLMYKAFNRERYKLPFIGDIADRRA